jgi:glycosyltransferase involved in cell wall biosynthesis
MRVLMVTRETGPDRRYGLGRSLAPVVEAMRGAQVDARYFCQDDLTPAHLQQRDRWWGRIGRLPFVKDRPALLALARAWMERLQVGHVAARLALDERYTHVHAHDPWIAAGVAWALLGTAPGRPRWGLSQHGFGTYAAATRLDGLQQGPFTQRLLRGIERFILRRADWVIAPTAAALDEVARELGEPPRPAHWHVVPHARPPVDPVTEKRRSASRALLGWRDDEFVVLSVGRLAPLKCFDRVIEACAAQGVPGMRLVILGDGDAAPLLQRAEALGFTPHLQIQAVPDVSPWLHGADLYVSASSTESFGLANLEALCAGLPAVCSAVGGVAEVVGDGAWLVPNDTQTLARCIATLRADPAARASWSARALARTATWPTPQDIAKRYVEIYRAAAPAA